MSTPTRCISRYTGSPTADAPARGLSPPAAASLRASPSVAAAAAAARPCQLVARARTEHVCALLRKCSRTCRCDRPLRHPVTLDRTCCSHARAHDLSMRIDRTHRCPLTMGNCLRCAHPCPERVAVIGGGDGGVIREICRHPCVKTVDHCELDKMARCRLKLLLWPPRALAAMHHVAFLWTRMTAVRACGPGCLAPATRPATPLGVSHCSQVCDVSRAHLPSLASALDDPRVTTHFSDGDSPARCSSLSTALTNPSALAAWFAVASSCICRAEFAVGSASATLAHLHWTWTSHHATRFVLMYVLRRCVAERAQGLL